MVSRVGPLVVLVVLFVCRRAFPRTAPIPLLYRSYTAPIPLPVRPKFHHLVHDRILGRTKKSSYTAPIPLLYRSYTAPGALPPPKGPLGAHASPKPPSTSTPNSPAYPEQPSTAKRSKASSWPRKHAIGRACITLLLMAPCAFGSSLQPVSCCPGPCICPCCCPHRAHGSPARQRPRLSHAWHAHAWHAHAWHAQARHGRARHSNPWDAHAAEQLDDNELGCPSAAHGPHFLHVQLRSNGLVHGHPHCQCLRRLPAHAHLHACGHVHVPIWHMPYVGV